VQNLIFAERAYSAPPDALGGFQVLTSKGKGGQMRTANGSRA